MRKQLKDLKSPYYAKHRDELLKEAKLKYGDGSEHFREHEEAIRRGVKAATLRRIENRAFFIAKLGGRCIDCGYDKNPSVLQFDHIEPHTKEVAVTSILTSKDREKIWKEVQKCTLRCANCHWEKTLQNKEIGRRPRHFQRPK
jgi:hypothetical protein